MREAKAFIFIWSWIVSRRSICSLGRRKCYTLVSWSINHMKHLKNLVLLVSAIIVLSIVAAAQNKPWVDWDKKDVDKMLNSSAWSHVQHDTDTSEMMYSTT